MEWLTALQGGRSQDVKPWTDELADTQSARPEPCDWSNTQVAPQRTLGGQLALVVPQLSREIYQFHLAVKRRLTDNDPSAGSPTETLLRLLLPLNTTVWSSSRKPGRATRQALSPRTSLKCSIGSSDGRCVQRAGT